MNEVLHILIQLSFKGLLGANVVAIVAENVVQANSHTTEIRMSSRHIWQLQTGESILKAFLVFIFETS